MSDFEVVLTGLIYVFAVLALIILLIGGISLLVRKAGGSRVRKMPGSELNKKMPAAPGETGKEAEEAARSPSGGAEASADEGELIAAIAAAVAAYRSEGGRPRFRLLSFKRIGRD